ncbi:MAG: rhomboid family intramembrane serine protease [Desulfovibrionaceae bacterium]
MTLFPQAQNFRYVRVLSRQGVRQGMTIRRRSRKIPRYWQRVDTCTAVLPSNHTLRLWALVLEARNIPFLQLSVGTRQQLYVPPLWSAVARHELQAFHEEGVRPWPLRGAAPHASGNWAVLVFVLLILWHGTVASWWNVPSFLPRAAQQFFTVLSGQAASLGALDAFKMWSEGEWFRAITALTLHASSQHVLGNMAFGSLFVTLLCRRVGLGCGLLLVVLGGALGNICNSGFRMYQSGAFVSIGFSTALFAAVGAMAGSLALAQIRVDRRKAFVPLAAGGAILAMLGAEGEHLYYMAHIFGLLCGFSLGAASQWLENRHPVTSFLQAVCAVLALLLVVLAWQWAV